MARDLQFHKHGRRSNAENTPSDTIRHGPLADCRRSTTSWTPYRSFSAAAVSRWKPSRIRTIRCCPNGPQRIVPEYNLIRIRVALAAQRKQVLKSIHRLTPRPPYRWCCGWQALLQRGPSLDGISSWSPLRFSGRSGSHGGVVETATKP